MEVQYLDETALKALVHRITTSSDPDSRENKEDLENILCSFHAYVDAVVCGETDLLFSDPTDGQTYRDQVMKYDQNRHGCHETAIINVRVLNRLALEDDAAKTNGHHLTAYMIDINYFKEINDRYGHAAGDAILRGVSETLKHLYPGGYYYRYGGDEFLVLTYKPPKDNYGADTYDFRQEEYGVTVYLSIGNAQGSPTNYHELFELISQADKALYVTKQRTHSAEFGGHDRRKPR